MQAVDQAGHVLLLMDPSGPPFLPRELVLLQMDAMGPADPMYGPFAKTADGYRPSDA